MMRVREDREAGAVVRVVLNGARLASLGVNIAAIAGARAASEFGLHIVAPAIQIGRASCRERV